ncbi:MAG: alginate export family protein, partial [Candidatus Zixiibacteriota bacterium]
LGYVFDVALQVGNQGASDISAYMMAGDFYYSPKDKIMFVHSEVSKIGIGFDITSGDDDPGDDDIKWFDNLYYTGHKFRGYMDYFIGSDIPPGLGNLGLMDIFLRGSLVAGDMGTIDIDIHHFRTMEDHIDASDTTATPGNSKALGQEIDVTYKSSIQEGLGFQGGISAFFASDEWRYNVDPSFWIYFMLTAGF